MPIKYIGRTTDFKGKTLWEILGNLKNFGVGRMVIRNKFQRYPEPCYMRILKIATLPAPTMKKPSDERKIVALIQNTFRGKTCEPEQIDGSTYKADFILVPKDEEDKYLRSSETFDMKVVPRTMDYPPLLKEIIKRQKKSEKLLDDEDPKMEIVYRWCGVKRYRLAEEGETPTVNFVIGLGTPSSPSLYANIKRESST
ncbi:uncharacterized protein LOC124428210 [Vespa crabro]|uniref:uncharacterized protein LOC124428210 n=1 Tax=Vespa crabro TaxID=7445 RepID=UPI001F005072|nr:uncharacterized protein LOC124428210 [Vespa crabro]XP_046827997.1 uncharacterized protein LOC124428210 [Vespa crabro]